MEKKTDLQVYIEALNKEMCTRLEKYETIYFSIIREAGIFALHVSNVDSDDYKIAHINEALRDGMGSYTMLTYTGRHKPEDHQPTFIRCFNREHSVKEQADIYEEAIVEYLDLKKKANL